MRESKFLLSKSRSSSRQSSPARSARSQRSLNSAQKSKRFNSTQSRYRDTNQGTFTNCHRLAHCKNEEVTSPKQESSIDQKLSEYAPLRSNTNCFVQKALDNPQRDTLNSRGSPLKENFQPKRESPQKSQSNEIINLLKNVRFDIYNFIFSLLIL